MNSQDKVYGSPAVVEVEAEDDDGEPPHKRAKVRGEGLRAESDRVDGELGLVDQTATGVRAARLSKPSAAVTKATTLNGSRNGDDSVARRADGVEPPPAAVRLPPPKNIADFSPWSGHHPEDVLNEAVVKAGYCDKGPGANQSECNSAKPSIWQNLSSKNNMGLQTLSYLFTQVMDKRQILGKCTAPSTFKPPPRVTVTDTKREAWLRDLANPDVPLRKQSRTIPHGIRGKLLMDQCLGKNIPLQRAVWLAKCVGANELRAFRRKGVSGVAAASGESKWVREWTVHVEQFLEGVIATCGQPEWQSRMNYAVRLTTGFYVEKLVDLDHYLVWIVSCLSNAIMERLPIWIVMARIYWDDIVKSLRRGRRLAEAVLERLSLITQEDVESSLSGGNRELEVLQASAEASIQANAEVATTQVEVSSNIEQADADPKIAQASAEATRIRIIADSIRALKSRLQKIIAALAITQRGCLVIPHTWEKYRRLLTPAAVPRAGPTRIADSIHTRNERLRGPLAKSPTSLRSTLLDLYGKLDAAGLQIDSNQLTDVCLVTVPSINSLISALLEWASSPYRHGASRLYLTARVISNIRAMGHDTDSNILTYLAAPISRALVQVNELYKTVGELIRLGSFAVGRYMQWLISSGALYTGQEMKCATGLLASLPVERLTPHVFNLRQTLLSRLETPSRLREHAELVQASVDAFETALSKSSVELPHSTQFPDGASLPVKIALAEHVSRSVRSLSKQARLGLGQFCLLRGVLETLSDVPTLVELMVSTSCTENPVLLATIADTVLRHAGSLAALGQLQNLTECIVERYRVLRSQQPLDRTLISAVIALERKLADTGPLLAHLVSDAAICDQQVSLAVCSPASDSLIGMHASSLDCDADIDAVFASGNSMDDQLMHRVFVRIVQRANKLQAVDSGPVSKLSAWLNQLRLVGGSSFDQLSSNYVRSLVKASGEGSASVGAVIALIASGCVSFNFVVTSAKDCGTRQAASLAMQLLLSPNAANVPLPVTETYRFQAMQAQCRSEQVETVCTLLCTACEDASFSVSDANVVDLLISCTTSDPCFTKRVFEQLCKRPSLLANAGRLANTFLMRSAPPVSTIKALSPDVIMKLAHPLSVQPCAGILEYYEKFEASKGIDCNKSVQDALIEAIVSGNEVWPQLLEAVPKPVKRGLHDWALGQLLLAANRPRGNDASASREILGRYMDVADVTVDSLKDRDATATLVGLTERLREVEKQLGEMDFMTYDAHESMLAFDRMLRIMLHICTLYTTPSLTETETCKQARGNLLLVLCALLVHPKSQMQNLAEYIGDVASLLADGLPEATLVGVARSAATTKLVDARVHAILGTTLGATDAWLALASQIQPPGTQQQRALAKHASQIPQASARSGAQGPALGGPQRAWPHVGAHRAPVEMKMTPFPLRRWEIMPDATPTMGENDSSLSVALFGARKA
ncbi:hypothetical protein LTR08_007695 [Meristemomyces frigidus]|nr:hypothetical protein LTR08_007695 [Meristemomyces frigidus]